MFKIFRKIFLLHFLILFVAIFTYVQLTSIILQKELFYLIGVLFISSLIISYLITKLIILPKDLVLINLQMDFDKFNDELKTKNHQKNFELELLNTAIQEKLNFQREQCEILQEKLSLEISLKEEKDQLLKDQSKLVSIGKISTILVNDINDSLLNTKEILGEINKESFDDSLKLIKRAINDIYIKNSELKNFIIPSEQKSEFYVDKVVMEVIKELDDTFVENNIKVDYNISKAIIYYGISSELTLVIFYIIENIKEALIEKNITSKKIFVRIKKDREFIHITISDNAGRVQDDMINNLFEANFILDTYDNFKFGLFISKMIIEENMKGKFEFENLNQGAKFIIKIPILEE